MDVASIIVFISIGICAVLVFFLTIRKVKKIEFEEEQRNDAERCFRENILACLYDIQCLLEAVFVDNNCDACIVEDIVDEFKE